MASRSIKGTSLNFGIVSIGVNVYTATTSHAREVAFKTLHREDSSPVRMPKICIQCGKELSTEETVKGFPIDKTSFVVLDESDLALLPLKSMQSIDILAFGEGDLPDPRMADTPYFLGASEKSVKAYMLLAGAMLATSTYAVAKFALRDREHLCVIRPFGKVLLLQTVHWADELKDTDEFIPDRKGQVSFTDKEKMLGVALVNSMKKSVNFGEYPDDYRDALLELVKAKQEGRVLTAAPVARKEETSLLDALEASLAIANKT